MSRPVVSTGTFEKPPGAPKIEPRPFNGELTAYARSALDGEIGKVASAVHPDRHKALIAAATALGGLIGGGELPRPLVEDQLRQACVTNKMFDEGREPEIEKTIRDGIEKGMLNPRRGDPPRKAKPEVEVPEEPAYLREVDGDPAEPEEPRRFTPDQEAALELIASLRSKATKEGAPPIWKPYSIAAMIRDVEKPAPALIEHILYEEDVTLICGPPKVTKSWLTTAMEIDAGLGRKVLGQYAVPGPLRILHADEEMGKRKIQKRLKALALGNKLTDDEIETLERNILMYPQQGMAFTSDAGLDELKRAIDTSLPRVLVFDSHAAFTSDADEKDNSARRRFYNRVLAPIKAAYKLGIIVLGHPPLPSRDAPPDSQKRMRGGGDVIGTCDRSLYLFKESDETNEFGRIVRCTLGEYVARESDGLDGPHALTLEDVDIDADGQRSTIFVSYGGGAGGVSTLDKRIGQVNVVAKLILHELRTILSGPRELYQPDLKKLVEKAGYSEDVYQAAINHLSAQTPRMIRVTDARPGRSGKWVELMPEDDE